MKNTMKKALAFLITLLMAVNIITVSAPADTGEYEPLNLRSRNDGVLSSGEFTYVANDDGTATITGFSEDADPEYDMDWTFIPRKLKNGMAVTAIADSAFKGNTNIGTLVIDACNIVIGDHAFENCINIWRVSNQSAPSGGSRIDIGKYAFAGCTGLEEFEFEYGIGNIGQKAFFNDTSLSSFVAGPGQVTTLAENNAFQNCGPEIDFQGGCSITAAYVFYSQQGSPTVTKIKSRSVEAMRDVNARQIDLQLDVDNEYATLEKSDLVTLLKETRNFKSVTLNLSGGVTNIAAGAIDEELARSFSALRVNIGGSETTVSENAFADNSKLHVHFNMNKNRVTGSEYLDELESYGIVSYEGSDPIVPNDGVLTYRLNRNESPMTATVTGFVSGLDASEQAAVTIPAAFSWFGAEYKVAAVAEHAFGGDESTAGNQNIQTVTILSPVMDIGDYAFCHCDNLTGIYPSAGGTGSYLDIGEYAFACCGSLQYFLSAPGVRSIGRKAFYDDPSLIRFSAGNSCDTEIMTNAFQCCSGELVFNGGINTIAWYAFYGSKVDTITTTAISDMSSYSLYEADNDIELVLIIDEAIDVLDADRLSSLMNNAQYFESVTLNLNKGANLIKEDAFEKITYLSSLQSLTVNVASNGSSMEVEEGAIPDETNLTVHIDMNHSEVIGSAKLADLEEAGRVTFKDTEGIDSIYHDDMFWYELDNGKAFVTGLFAEDTDWEEIVISSKTRDNKYNVAGVKANAFKDNATIRKITFDNEMSCAVKEDAFKGMTALEEICINRKNLTLPAGVFANCTALNKVTIGTAENQDASITIPKNAFSNCGALSELTVHFRTATVIEGAFTGCTGLKTVVFTGSGSQKIQAGAFTDAQGIQYLRLDNTYNVEAGAFAVVNGKSFVQNKEDFLSGPLPDKIGSFESYVFTGKSPYVLMDDVFRNHPASTIYVEYKGTTVPEYLINAVGKAGTELTDLYLNRTREEVPFADELEAANRNVKIHYLENYHAIGLYVDGVDGSDTTGDGSTENPFKTFAKAREALESKQDSYYGQSVTVADEEIANTILAACSATGATTGSGTFNDIYTQEKEINVLNTITVSGNELWSSGNRKAITLVRNSSFTGPLVNVTGTLTLDHVILDGNRKEVTAKASLIVAKTGAALTLGDGAVLRNNVYPQAEWDGYNFLNGGAVYAQNATVNVLDGCIIENNEAMSGGGIMMNGGVLNMNGGTIRGNTARATKYQNNQNVNGTGGGVTLIMGASMNMSGGLVTGNKADGQTSYGIGINGSAGGGIHVGSGFANQSTFTNGSSLIMTGGTVSDNSAYAEGGGIYIQASSTATITGGRITGNKSGGGEFGGGGIYVNGARQYGTVNGMLKLNNVLITDNDAPYGGGIACCETVHLSIYMGSGSAIYDNKDTFQGRNNDVFLFQRNSAFEGNGTKAKIAMQMMNGADYNWTYVVVPSYKPSDRSIKTGDPVPEDVLAYLDAGKAGHVVMKSNPSNKTVDAKVTVSGNTAETKGGGIGSNGDIVIGDVPTMNEVRISPTVSKKITGRDMKDNEEFRFSVYLETSTSSLQGNDVLYTYSEELIGRGVFTAGKDGETKQIALPGYNTGKIGTEQLGDRYTLLVVEDTISSDDLKADEHTYYAFTYTIGQGKDSNGNPCYTAYLIKTEKGEYNRSQSGDIEYQYGAMTYPGKAYTYYQRIRTEISEAEAVFVNEFIQKETPTPTSAPTPTPTATPTATPIATPTGTTTVAPTPTPTPKQGTGIKEKTVRVKKVWDDMNDLDGSRPDSITVTLLADGTEKQTITLNEENGWEAEVTGLPGSNAIGEEISYTWREETVPGYTRKMEADGNETIFTNTHVPELTSVSVRKVWNDNDDETGERPQQIVMMLSNGMTVTLNKTNNWTATISNLPVYYEGEKIEYYWTEPEVIGYNAPAVDQRGNLTEFTNSLWTRPDKPKKGKRPMLPGKPVEKLDDYETPLGVEALINHVGDCFD